MQDMLDGGIAADTMIGGTGDDTYRVDNAGDIVVEAAGAGYDTVLAIVDETMPVNVEALYMVGSGLTGTGSSNADSLLSTGGAAREHHPNKQPQSLPYWLSPSLPRQLFANAATETGLHGWPYEIRTGESVSTLSD